VETFTCRWGLLILALTVNPYLRLLDHVDVGNVANVSKVNSAPIFMVEIYNNNNSVPLVHERTIQTARQSLVGEVSANFLRIESVAWSTRRISAAVISVF
jgi:hypothetical protein